MRHQPTSNGGFRWQEISRARFQETTAGILGDHKNTIDAQAAKIKAQGEFIADMSIRLDEHAKQIALHQASFTAWGARTLGDRFRWLFSGK